MTRDPVLAFAIGLLHGAGLTDWNAYWGRAANPHRRYRVLILQDVAVPHGANETVTLEAADVAAFATSADARRRIEGAMFVTVQRLRASRPR